MFESVQQVARPWSWVSYWREDREYCERKQPPSGPGESLFSLIQGFKYMCMRFSYLFLGDQRRLGQASTYGQSCQSLCCLHTQTEHIDERSVRPSPEALVTSDWCITKSDVTGPVKQKKIRVKLRLFSYPSV